MHLKNLVLKSARRQHLHCHYCGLPMWHTCPARFIDLIGLHWAGEMQCTAEHLMARKDGGLDTERNIVAAHRVCNERRHAGGKNPSASAYHAHVQREMRGGRWLPNEVAEALRSANS